MQYRQLLVPEDVQRKVTSGYGNWKEYIVVHETDNTGIGADADAHARLQRNGNSRQASWHWSVDSKEAVQSFLHDIRCWAAGTNQGNDRGIHVEICVNRDGDFQTAMENGAALVAHIMKLTGIPIDKVVQHNHFSGKNCPRNIRAGNPRNWAAFLQMVKGAAGIAKPAPIPTDATLYRVQTGTWADKRMAENARELMKTRFGWVAHVVEDSGNYRVKTGTFKGKAAAQAAAKKVMDAGIAGLAYEVKEEK
jgi:N-acetylmuramoyl-L-alanine amidase